MSEQQMVSKLRGRVHPRQVGVVHVTAKDVKQYAKLQGIGIMLDDRILQRMIDNLAPTMDSMATGTLVSPVASSLATPIQFLQMWLPGFVRAITQARKIDILIGISTVGQWEHEEVVQGMMAPIGGAELYSDAGNIPLASYAVQYERRTIVRFEKGISVSVLEEKRAAMQNVSVSSEKRNSATLSLEISRNRVGFFGFSNGTNRTYGFLNDPSLPAYNTVPAGAASTTTWATKTFLEITADIRAGVVGLQVQSGDTINPEDVDTVLTVATNVYGYLSVNNVQGTQSVRTWIKETYPRMRIESAPELNLANGGANVYYMWAEQVEDGSTDDHKVIDQIVPAKFLTLGVEKRSKNYLEDYSNATAGVMCKRPYATYRATGI